MNKINSLHHVKEHPQISNFLQFESHSSKRFKVRAIGDLRDLYGNKTGTPNGPSTLVSAFAEIHSTHPGVLVDVLFGVTEISG